ncbi:Uncharacterised protein [Escherichia coli]|nr:Uncharacterised protein [Escherichia coli]
MALNNARVTSNDVTGQHVVMTTGEVADDAARFTNQQLACGEVPRAQTDFKETVNTTRSDVSQIQRRRTGTTEVCTFVEQFADDVDVGSGVLFCFERESRSPE